MTRIMKVKLTDEYREDFDRLHEAHERDLQGRPSRFERPDHVKCALKDTWEGEPARPTYETWCGLRTGNIEWTFTNANHALLNGLNGGRLQLCYYCATAIKSALDCSVEDSRRG